MERTRLLIAPGLGGVVALVCALGCGGEGPPDEVQVQSFGLHEAAEWGYLWNDRASHTLGQAYSPDPGYARTFNGGAITITRTAPGFYRVRFPGLDSQLAGITHVVAHGADDRHCALAGPPMIANGALQITVTCFGAASGIYEDSRWVLTHTLRSGAVGEYYSAYFYNHLPDSPLNQEVLLGGYNSAGENRITRRDVGTYSVKLTNWPTPAPNVGSVQVTRVGLSTETGWKGSCQLFGSAQTGGRTMNISVVCHGLLGQLSNARFNLTFSTLSPAGGRSAGYVTVLREKDPLHTPAFGRRRIQINGMTKTDTIQAENVGGPNPPVGVYNVFFNSTPSLNGIGSVPLVTVDDSDPGYCKLDSWGGSAEVNLHCRSVPGGEPWDLTFNAGYVTDQQQ